MTARGAVIFVDDPAQVAMVRQMAPDCGAVVALTAHAVDALDAAGLAYEAVSAYADTRLLPMLEEEICLAAFDLLFSLENAIRREGLEDLPPGFLTGHAHYVQYSLAAIAMRVFLMREAIRALRPRRAVAFPGPIHPWFAGDSPTQNPWLTAAKRVLSAEGAALEILAAPSGRSVARPRRFPTAQSALTGTPALMRAAVRRVGAWSAGLERGSDGPTSVPGAGRLRLLLVGGPSLGRRFLAPVYEWEPVVRRMRSSTDDCYLIATRSVKTRPWSEVIDPVARHAWRRERIDLPVGSHVRSEVETARIAASTQAWLDTRVGLETPSLPGIDLLPGIAQQVLAIADASPALARQVDATAAAILSTIRPTAVGFSATPTMAAQLLADHMRAAGVPVVTFQHGGAYGTNGLAQHELTDFSHSDYFLTFGSGIKPRPVPAFSVTAQFIPVGSTRVEAVARRNHRSSDSARPISVLFIAASCTRNTYGGFIHEEDTRRYLTERRALKVLSRGNATRVTYRPLPSETEWQGVVQWIRRMHPRGVSLNTTTSLVDLARRSDVVVSRIASSTSWNEVLALGRPMLLYCEPGPSHMLPHFAELVRDACVWTTTEEGFMAAIERLATGDADLLRELRSRDPTQFLREFVLGDPVGRAVDRVITFLHGVSVIT